MSPSFHSPHSERATTTIALLLLATAIGPIGNIAAQPTGRSRLDGLVWRELGPRRSGGRINDLAIPAPASSQRAGTTMYAAHTGGIYRTTDGGRSWQPIFDRQNVSAINTIAVAPSDPRVVWAGTGDPNNARHILPPGNGLYKSADSGNTWTHVGFDRQ